MANAQNYGHRHAEAFCIMKYQADDDPNDVEWIWNSRDGVTPFTLTLQSGKPGTHVDWHLDQYAPEYKPPSGSRMFVDMTRERAMEIATRNAQYYWNDQAAAYNPQTMFASKDQMIRELAASYMDREGTPDIATVGLRAVDE